MCVFFLDTQSFCLGSAAKPHNQPRELKETQNKRRFLNNTPQLYFIEYIHTMIPRIVASAQISMRGLTLFAVIATALLLVSPCQAFSVLPTTTRHTSSARIISNLRVLKDPDTQIDVVTDEESSKKRVALLPDVSLDAIMDNNKEFLDNSESDLPDVVCARGVCVIAEDVEVCVMDETLGEIVCEVNAAVTPGLTVAYLWPRGLLLICSVLYGTNFPLGRLMNESLPASAATSARMLLAALALSPFLLQLKPNLRGTAAVCGTFTALGYISQSIALVDTPAATVSFLGALVVIVCPTLAVLVDQRPMAFKDAPQTWIAALLCLLGVGVLELGGGGDIAMGWGDFWSVLQAVGFGTSFYITERMMAKEPSQALPITAMQCSMSAAFAGIWALLDGNAAFGGAMSFDLIDHGAWLQQQLATVDTATTKNVFPTFSLPAIFMDVDYRAVALAAAFTGFVTTAGNRVGETMALGKLSSSEASVLLATEPLWAALFASFLIGENLSLWDGIGGAIIVLSCAATALDPKWLREILNIEYNADQNSDESTLAP